MVGYCFLFEPSGTKRPPWTRALRRVFLSVSIVICVPVTDGGVDSGELDLSGIDDSEIELVCT